MKSLTIAIALRIFTLIMIGLYMMIFHDFYFWSDLLRGWSPYILGVFMLTLLLMSRQQHVYKKNHPSGRLTFREKILPEFNSNDERESGLTGQAAKTALSLILILTPFVLLLLSFLIFFEVQSVLLYMNLALVLIPIIGLIGYYLSYRYHYLQ